ncbi:MAG TPA: glycoside hydrolase family 97 catalytic domain-containing protein [Acidobacteriaceae bacterium]
MKIFLILAITASSIAFAEPATRLRSPHGTLEAGISVDRGAAMYTVQAGRKDVLLPSRLGLSNDFDNAFVLRDIKRSGHSSTWKPLYGERDLITDSYNAITFSLVRKDGRTLRVELRAYDEGIAVRYGATSAMDIAADATEFHLPPHSFGYQEHGGTEGEYSRTEISNIAPKCQTPLTIELANGLFAAILEAGSINFPVMYVGTKPGSSDILLSSLSASAHMEANTWTPWRVIMVAKSAAELLEHDYLQLNLNRPQAIADTQWIKPGTAIRETSLTTAGAKKLIDYAGTHGIQYIGFDDHWYGAEDIPHGDATHERTRDDNGKPVPPLNIAEVAAYGKAHNVGLIVYVDRRQLFKQRDILFPLYESWGVAGVKAGFVDVGTQANTAWITETVRKAAEHHLVLDIHDQYRTTGYTRTFPNLLTVEGVRGNEHFPTAEHNATLPFTRFLAGAADVTICYFDKRLKNTHAHQMAMSVVAYSPLQWIFWYDSPASMHNEPELPWFENLPTVWNETRVPAGEIGKYAVLARRSGTSWYVGAVTNSEARTVPLALNFLKGDGTFTATLYRDDPSVDTATHVAVEKRTVTKNTVIDLVMPANGGFAIKIVPAGKD